jgi:hypothetical protein
VGRHAELGRFGADAFLHKIAIKLAKDHPWRRSAWLKRTLA